MYEVGQDRSGMRKGRKGHVRSRTAQIGSCNRSGKKQGRKRQVRGKAEQVS